MDFLDKKGMYKKAVEDPEQFGKVVTVCGIFNGEKALHCEEGDCSKCLVPLQMYLKNFGAR